jgi:hypothetical protein
MPRRKQQSKKDRSIIDTLNVCTITVYFERNIKILTSKRRKRDGERVIMTTWTKGENGQRIRWTEGKEKRQGCKGRKYRIFCLNFKEYDSSL